MEVVFDEAKRQKTLRERGLDFADAVKVLDGIYIVQDDDRKRYPEPRFQTYGHLDQRLVMFAWTPNDGGIRIISMRKCNEREQRKFERWLG
jgi:uncharacterized protein